MHALDPPTPLDGRTVVIIGGTSGIGRAAAERAASRDAEVIVCGRSRERAEAVATEIGSGTRGTEANLADAESLRTLFDGLDRVDHLVITAADLEYEPFETMDPAIAERVMSTKLLGSFRAVQMALPKMPADGSVVLVSGLAVDRPGPGTSAVSATNGAIDALSRSLALEAAPIRVNAVSPGVTDTPGWDFMPEAERREFFASVGQSLPVGRVGRPEDSGDAIVFLMTAGFVTGEVLHVDGGGRFA